jgi:hypothetical protein
MKIYIVSESNLDCEGRSYLPPTHKYFLKREKAIDFINRKLKTCEDAKKVESTRWTHYWGEYRLRVVNAT